MEKRIMYYWRELNKRYSSDQVFFLLCYWIIATYQQSVKGISISFDIREWKKILVLIFNDSIEDNLKISVERLSGKIEWTVVENDSISIELLRNLAEELKDFFSGEQRLLADETKKYVTGTNRLQVVMKDLLGFAELNGLYSITPSSIGDIMANIASKMNVHSMLDLCCGNGGLGVDVWQRLKNRDSVEYCGIDIEPVMCDICRIMVYLYGVSHNTIKCQDALRNSQDEMNQKYDLVLLDVPRGKNEYTQIDEYTAWLEGVEEKNLYVDWLFIMRALNVLNDTGKAMIAVTSGTLTRKNESTLRKKLILEDEVEAVITLPVNLYPNTRTGTEIVIFNKSKAIQRKQKILFIDISKCFLRDNRNFYSLTSEGVNLAVDIFEKYYEVENISCIQEISQLEKGGWSLKPLRYMQSFNKKEEEKVKILLRDVARITRGVQLKKEEEERLCACGTAFYINIKDINERKLQYEHAKKIQPKSKEWDEKFRIQEDDILITSKGTTLKIVIVEENPPDAYICGNITILRVNKERYHPYLLFEYLNSKEGLNALESIQSGTTIRVLSNSNLGELSIPVYDRELMFSLGEQFKNSRRQYENKRKELDENYRNERKELLELIGIKVQEDGKWREYL